MGVLRVVLVGLLAVVILGAASAAGASRPTLDVQTDDPFRVRGEAFRPFELVRVTAEIDGRTNAVSRRAGRRGRFWAMFPGDVCTATVSAVGSRWSKASVSFAHVTCRPTS